VAGLNAGGGFPLMTRDASELGTKRTIAV